MTSLFKREFFGTYLLGVALYSMSTLVLYRFYEISPGSFNIISTAFLVSSIMFTSLSYMWWNASNSLVSNKIRTKEIVYLKQDFRAVFAQAIYPVIELNKNKEILWQNKVAEEVIGNAQRLQRVLSNVQTNENSLQLVRHKQQTYSLQAYILPEGVLLEFLPLQSDAKVYNQIVTPQRDMPNKDLSYVDNQFKNIQTVITDSVIELNFLFQSTKTLIEIQAESFPLLFDQTDIEQQFKSFLTNIHQLIKDHKGSLKLLVSANEIDERAQLKVFVEKLKLQEDYLSDDHVDTVLEKFNKIEKSLTQHQAAITIRYINRTDGLSGSEFLLSFDNIPPMSVSSYSENRAFN